MSIGDGDCEGHAPLFVKKNLNFEKSDSQYVLEYLFAFEVLISDLKFLKQNFKRLFILKPLIYFIKVSNTFNLMKPLIYSINVLNTLNLMFESIKGYFFVQPLAYV